MGTYGVATYGSFYVDGLIRYDYFQTQLNSPTGNLFNQSLDANGFTAASLNRLQLQGAEFELVCRTQSGRRLVERTC